MNVKNLDMLQFCLIVFIIGFILFRSCDLKRDDSTIEKAVFVYSIFNMVLGFIGIIASIVLFMLDLF